VSDRATEILPGGEPLIARIRAETAATGLMRIRLALGYLFIPGLAPFWHDLESSAATEIQLLIGNTAETPTDEQQFAASAGVIVSGLAPQLDMAAAARAARDLILAETARSIRENLQCMAKTEANERLALSLARAMGANRVRVRVYPDGRLHTKAVLFERAGSGGSIAIVGATNVTLPTSGNPTQINVLIRESETVTAVAAWFDALWDSGQDFTRALFTELSASWPLAS
jgi:hypothetical protein